MGRSVFSLCYTYTGFVFISLVLCTNSWTLNAPQSAGYLKNFLSQWNPQTSDARDGFQKTGSIDKDYLRRVFFKLDIKNTDLGRMLDSPGDEMPDVFGLIQRLQSDPELKQQLQEQLISFLDNKIATPAPMWERDEDEDWERGEDRDQIRGYEGCRRDYASSVEWLTDPLFGMIYNCDDPENVNTTLCQRYPDGSLPNTSIPRTTFPESQIIIDSLAKIPSGVMEGKLHWVGGYESCHRTDVEYTYINESYGTPGVPTENRRFTGKYCRLSLKPSETFPAALTIGACYPDTCSRSDIRRYIYEDNYVIYAMIEGLLGMNVSWVYCGQEVYHTSKVETGYYASIGVCGFLLVVVLIATFYDGLWRKGNIERKTRSQIDSYNSRDNKFGVVGIKTEPSSQKTEKDLAQEAYEYEKPTIGDRLELMFVGFSGYSNFRRVFTSKLKKNHLDVLNGFRALTFLWTLAGQTVVMGPIYNELFVTSNLLTAATTLPTKFYFQPIMNFVLASDSFFLLSGMLATYWWLQRHEAQGRLTIGQIVYYIAHKYWRLLPANAYAIFLFYMQFRYSEESPMFPTTVQDGENCDQNWWTNLLYIHNLVNQDSMCFGWSWYLAIVFQLHLISLIILIPLVVKPRLGHTIFLLVFSFHIMAATFVATQSENGGMNWYYDFLQKPWTRAGPYLIGIVIGWLMFKIKTQPNYNLDGRWAIIVLGWLFSLGVVLTLTFVTYDKYQADGRVWSTAENVAMLVLGPIGWSLSCGWIILACIMGYGGFINSFLTWRAFMPLSKLAYSCYLMHTMMIFGWIYGQFTLIYMDIYNLLYIFLGHLAVCYNNGFFLVTVLVQYPISIGLERAVMCKTKYQAFLAGRHPWEHDKVVGVPDSPRTGSLIEEVEMRGTNAYEDTRTQGPDDKLDSTDTKTDTSVNTYTPVVVENNIEQRDSTGQDETAGQRESTGQEDTAGQTDSTGQEDTAGQRDSTGQDDTIGQRDSTGQRESNLYDEIEGEETTF